jgi:protein-S-isoprenylcysteine O-methyltransferase Ste14
MPNPGMVETQRKKPMVCFRCLLAIPVPWVFVLAYLVGAGLQLMFFRRSNTATLASLHVPGIVLFALGAALAGWAWLIFHKAGTTRIPGKASTTLVTTGPYHVTRNPMYIGLALAYLGEAGILKQVTPVAILPFVIAYLNWVVIPVEEARLYEVFGERYETYRSSVRRWV